MAEDVLHTQGVDLIGMTRALIADPWFVRKARMGNETDIRRCIRCNQGCAGRIWHGVEIGCVQNPDAGRESTGTENRWRRTRRTRRLAVLGGGPAGLEAACTSACFGHEVTLFEAGDLPGGQVLLFSDRPAGPSSAMSSIGG